MQFKDVSWVDTELPKCFSTYFILCIGLCLIIKMGRDKDTGFFL